jgi:predicted DNA-binding WGR domain protein
MFPMTVKKESGRAASSSGGKDYHLLMISSSDGRAIVVNRWGRKGQWGTGWSCKYYDDASEARSDYKEKYKQKLGRDYSEHFLNRNDTAQDLDELKKHLGRQYVATIGKTLGELVTGMDTTGLRETEPESEFAEDANGNWRKVDKQRRTLEPAKPEEPKVVDLVKQNSNWGTWG